MKYTFFLDIDGTLINKNNPNPSEHLIRIVSQARSEGHRFFINTARSTANIDPKRFSLHLFDGLCSGCGTQITYRGECIYEHTVPPEEVFGLAERVTTRCPDINFVLEGIDALYVSVEPWKPQNIKYDSVAELREKHPDLKIQKFATSSNQHIPQEVTADFEDRFDIYRHPSYTEIVPKGYSKGKAAEIVEKLLDIPHESTVAVGDSDNDIPMMEYCAVSVAMGDSTEKVKEKCTMITDSVDEDGAAKAIAKICGIPYPTV